MKTKKLRKLLNQTSIIITLLSTIFICIALLIFLSPNFKFPTGMKAGASTFITFPDTTAFWPRITSRSQEMTVDIPLEYIPQGTSMNVSVLRATIPDKVNTELFGVADLQGIANQQASYIASLNAKYGQTLPTENFTGLLDRSFAMAALAGVRFVVLDFSWSDIPSTLSDNGKREFNWSYTDRVFEAAKKYKITLVPIIAYSPSYAREGQTAAYDKRCLPKDMTPAGSAMYNEFLAAIVSRYRANGGSYSGVTPTYGINNWIVWNEPNNGFLEDCDGVKGDRATGYASLFKGAYKTIHEQDPDNTSNLKVIMAALATPPVQTNDPRYAPLFLTTFYSNLGSSSKPDILNLHYHNDSPDVVTGASANDLQDVLNRFIATRAVVDPSRPPIWLTEVGRAYDTAQPEVSTQFMDNAFTLIKNSYANDPKKIEKVFWWSGTGEEKFSVVGTDFTPRETYLRLGEHWLHAFSFVDKIRDLAAGSDKLTVKLTSKQLPEMNFEYALLTEAPDKKAALQIPYIIGLEAIIPPNCQNITGPTTVKLGDSGSYSANFLSQQQNLIGQIFYDSGDKTMNNLGKEKLPGTQATYSVTWTPSAPGTYSICCSAWNGENARCAPEGYDYGATTCAGPNSCLTVSVPSRTPSNIKMPSSGEILSISMTFVPAWEKYQQHMWVQTSDGPVGYVQKIPKKTDGTPDWDNADHWSKIGSGAYVYDQDETMTGLATVMQVIWYPEGAKTRFGLTRTDGTTNWSQTLGPVGYPYSGTPQSVTGETFTNPKDGSQTYFQAIWINDQQYFRSGSIDPSTHEPTMPPTWNGPTSLEGLPPNDNAGSIQAQDITLMPEPSNTVLQRIVRGNAIYWRTIPLNDIGMPDWSRASGWILR